MQADAQRAKTQPLPDRSTADQQTRSATPESERSNAVANTLDGNLAGQHIGVLQLQRAIGNRATERVIQQRQSARVADLSPISGALPTRRIQAQAQTDGGTGNAPSGLQRVQDAIAAANLEVLTALQKELRVQMAADPINPPADARAGLATARHWTMDRIAVIRDTYTPLLDATRSGRGADADETGPLEVTEILMDAECSPYLDVLLQGDPQYRYEHFNTTVSEKVSAAVRLHTLRRGVSQIGHRDDAEAESRAHGKIPKGTQPSDDWCGAFAYTQAEQGGGFDPHWAVHMQGEQGIRTALTYGGEMATTWIWAFDHWELLQSYHAGRQSLRWYEAIERTPPKQGIQAGDLVLIDNAFGTNPDHITTAIAFDGRFLTTIGGNQGAGEQGVSRNHAFDILNNPDANDVRKTDAKGERIREVDPKLGPKHTRVHGIGRWSLVDYERHLYRTSTQKPTTPPAAADLAKLS